MLTSQHLVVGGTYTRKELIHQFGIKDATVHTGIFRPKGHDSIWLFVTEQKTADRTQYTDSLHGDDLYMDGQTAGRTDAMLISHSLQGLEVLLFHRRAKAELPGYGFRYEGLFRYVNHQGAGPAHFYFQRIPTQHAYKHEPRVNVQLRTNSITEVALALNKYAPQYAIGRLQILRAAATGKRKMRSSIFDVPSKGVNEEEGWAYHFGGRTEFQFNIGFERKLRRFRFGLAFSFEPSRFVTDVVEHLAPKVERFNRLILSSPELLSRWRMWVWDGNDFIKADTAARQVAPDESQLGRFVFVGGSLPTGGAIDVDLVLRCFDELLPIYRCVEGHAGFESLTPTRTLTIPDESLVESTVSDLLEQLESRRSGGQGFMADPECRKAVEKYAVERAKTFFRSRGYTDIQERGKPYDLLCRRDSGETLYVEVKGTSTPGTIIILTANEVRHTEENENSKALYVLSDIHVTSNSGIVEVNGGKESVSWPWKLDQSRLSPLVFKYELP